MNTKKADATILAWEDELHTKGSVRVKTSRGKLAGLLLACIAFTLAGLWMTTDSGFYVVIGWVAIIFFGVLGIPVMLWRLVSGGPFVTVTPDRVGISDAITVPWADIEGVLVTETSGARSASLRFRSEEAQRRALEDSASQSLLRGVNNSITGAPEVALPTGLTADPGVLGVWLGIVFERFRETHRPA